MSPTRPTQTKNPVRRLGRTAFLAACASAAVLAAAPRAARAEADTFGLGTGRDLALNVTTAGVVINSYASVTANVSGATPVAVDTVVGFAAGNLVLIWQTTGLSAADAPNGIQTPITLAGKNTGHYEMARIESVGATTLVLTNPLVNSYRAGTAQVIRVPEYTTVDISGAGTIVPGQVWNGSKGGVVAFLANGLVTNNGVISADAAGFRGGVLVNHAGLNNCNAASMGIPSDGTPATGYSPKGEGLVPAAFNPAVGGRTNVANGGGGGVCHNSGGGGGANAGPGGLGGRTWMGDGAGRFLGGYGGAPLVYDPLSILSFGGGGGSGDENNDVGVAGGRGGGMIFIRGSSLAGTGIVRANGEKPIRAGGPAAANDAAGGGGGGGAIVLRVAGGAACASVQANGGDGGDTVFGSNPATDPHGPGGGGGGGRIYIESGSGACTGTTNAGIAGRWNATLFHDAGPTSATDAGFVGVVTAVNTGFPGDTCTPAEIAAGLCGGCVAFSDCGGAAPTCDLGSNACAGCTADFGGSGRACPTAALPGCLLSGASAGTCVECVADGNCAGNVSGTICDTGKNTCGTCTAAALSACTGATPACNQTPAHNLCAACDGDFGSATAAACPTSALRACVGSGAGAGTCAECNSSADCAGHPNGSICDTAKRTCGTCAPGDAAACVGTTPVCDTSGASDVCAMCNGDFGTGAARACPVMGVPFCLASGVAAGACVSCRNSGDCGGAAPICDAMIATCAACDADFGASSLRACPMAAPFCAPGGGACSVMCTTDAQCGAGNWCDAGTCGPQVPNGQPVPGGACIAALAARACITGVCDVSDNGCGIVRGNMGCLDQADCRSGACVTSGGNAGTCLDCNTDPDCAGATPVCHATSNLCVACGPGNSSQCLGLTPVCNTTAGACIPCAADASSANPAACPGASPTCVATGACIMCTSNLECTMGTHAGPICNTSSGACGTSCTTDPDCAATDYCDNPTAAAFAGTCTPKLANSSPIPAPQPFASMCTDPVGLRVCRSGVCEAGDDLCGLRNDTACTAAAQCRSDQCHTDARCGLPNGETCMNAAVCRTDVCHTDARCGLPNGETCASAAVCRTSTCFTDNLCGLPDGQTCASPAVCRSGLCSAGKCGAPLIPDAGVADAMPMPPRDGGAADAAPMADAKPMADALAMNDANNPGQPDAGQGGQAGQPGEGGASGSSGEGGAAGGGGEGAEGGGDVPGDLRIGGGGCHCHFGAADRAPGLLPLGLALALLGRRRRRRR